MVHGSLIGLTDDEAYYWVLAQKPALGYAYHPPMVAWLIAAAQALFSGTFGNHAEGLVRLPAALSSAGLLYLSLIWIRKTGAPEEKLSRSALLLLSFAGLFSLSWMMVPDLPLLIGWMATFLIIWDLCFGPEPKRRHYVFLAFATIFTILSKYSGIFATASAGAALLIWAKPERKKSGVLALVLGCALASVPIIAWNATHGWASILYQIRDRHEGGSFSLLRYGRFWAVEIVATGPFFIAYVFDVIWKRRAHPHARVHAFALVWMLPAAVVFGLQPLWSDFKPHWAFVAWWPVALAMAQSYATDTLSVRRRALIQTCYGLVLGSFVIASCHFPVGGWVMERIRPGSTDPRWDVTNDLYGWGDLRSFLERTGPDLLKLPVIGSRYQTASQALFAIGESGSGTLLPRDLKARDEWPELPVSDGFGPEWPHLKSAVLFVADNRYDAGPEFPGAKCVKLGRLEKSRSGYLAKWIDVWRCEPDASQVLPKTEVHHQSRLPLKSAPGV